MDETAICTGVEWIGNVPAHWDCEALRYLVNLNSRQSSYSPERPYIALENIESWTGNVFESDVEVSVDSSVNEFLAGDVLFGKLRPYLAKVVRAEYSGTSSMELLALTPGKLTQGYLFYTLLCKGFIDTVDSQTYGVKMPRTSWDQLRVMRFPVPPADEQVRITEYLDVECGRIDQMISIIKEQTEALDNYRKSLIQEVVTRGVDPKAEMKPSGIDWIGDIPTHWQLKKIKNISESRNGLDYVAEDVCGPDDAGSTLVVRSSNLDGNGMVFDDCVYLSKRIPSVLRLRKDDIVIVRTNGSRELVGKNALVPNDGVGTIGAFMLLCRTPYPRYLHWILNSQLFPRYLGTFETSTVNQITNGNLRNMVIPFCPDSHEREEICDYLDSKCAAIDRLIAGKRKQLETLRAQRQSLIYEYVTGKRRVV